MSTKPTSRDLAAKRGVEAIATIEFNRAYALAGDADAMRAVAALSSTWIDRQAGDYFGIQALAREVFEPLSGVPETGLRQARPKPESELPQPWQDPISKAIAKNPWIKPYDLSSQMELGHRDPELAAHLKLLATNDDGLPSYKMLARFKDEALLREQLRGVKYGPEEHARNNPYVSGNLTAVSEFAKTHAHEPWLIDFYKREATTPVRLFVKNLTVQMAITKGAPQL
ncbi:MAG: hypothetical protein ABIR71_00100, partial [Chthoniobacterales bacterium]